MVSGVTYPSNVKSYSKMYESSKKKSRESYVEYLELQLEKLDRSLKRMDKQSNQHIQIQQAVKLHEEKYGSLSRILGLTQDLVEKQQVKLEELQETVSGLEIRMEKKVDQWMAVKFRELERDFRKKYSQYTHAQSHVADDQSLYYTYDLINESAINETMQTKGVSKPHINRLQNSQMELLEEKLRQLETTMFDVKSEIEIETDKFKSDVQKISTSVSQLKRQQKENVDKMSFERQVKKLYDVETNLMKLVDEFEGVKEGQNTKLEYRIASLSQQIKGELDARIKGSKKLEKAIQETQNLVNEKLNQLSNLKSGQSVDEVELRLKEMEIHLNDQIERNMGKELQSAAQKIEDNVMRVFQNESTEHKVTLKALIQKNREFLIRTAAELKKQQTRTLMKYGGELKTPASKKELKMQKAMTQKKEKLKSLYQEIAKLQSKVRVELHSSDDDESI